MKNSVYSIEVVVPGGSVKKMFLKISQNLQENNDGVSF